jgi:hypothetical protein
MDFNYEQLDLPYRDLEAEKLNISLSSELPTSPLWDEFIRVANTLRDSSIF